VRPVEQGEGDSSVIAFTRVSDAVACALALQGAPLAPLRLRIGVHAGELQLRDEGNYVGPFEWSQPVGVDAAAELLSAVQRRNAELLVIGVKHRNPVGKLLLGSVSQQVLLECPKPVLAVKPDE
jgi:nucleotide-binding universal stress UspA family protein